ncbi:MAG TPA: adenylate/guanylate cyclase domain-containing protein [Gammaproteobacteria bacterium]|nr:adenylate/guanylate cyclase domain-containing protein [Gammaproteobacteria bacterium]
MGLIGLVASLIPSTFELEEFLGLNVLFRLRGAVEPPAEVVIVGISREAARALGQTEELDTWPRELHAQLVDRLAAAGVTTIAFDLIFSEPREGPGDELFAKSIAKAGNVLLLEETSESSVVPLGGVSTGRLEIRTPPLPALGAAALGTAPFILPEVPVRVSQSWTFDRVTDETPSLPVLALQAHLLAYYEEFARLLERARPGSTSQWPATGAAVQEQRSLERTVGALRRTLRGDVALRSAALEQLRGGNYPIATQNALLALLDLYSGTSSQLLNFYGAARAIHTVPYDQALKGTDGIDWTGKVVLVGMSEPVQPRQQDDFISVFSQNTGINLSGVEVGATRLANLLQRHTLRTLPLSQQVALVVVLGVVLGALVGRLTMLRASAVVAIGAALYFAAAYWQFSSHYVWLPLVVPLLLQLPLGFGAAVWWNYRDVSQQRERVQTALGYYVPPSLARRLSEQTVSAGTNRELLHGTCLVTDAEHYTSIAERLSPAELAVLMNDYYESVFRVVQAYGGEISDTAGDSMIAVWASAEPDAAVRLRAAEASLAILETVAAFNREHPQTPLPTRIGLESGEMLLGNIGAEQRYEYRAIGDIVNTAARIQGLNQPLGTRVLISAATLDEQARLPSRDVGTFLLRGKRLPVRVVEPLSAATCALGDEELSKFAAALAAFRAGSWREAHERFAPLAERFFDDGPSRYYDATARAFLTEPPASWTGAIRLTSK